MYLTFGMIRKYISKIDRVSICTAEDLRYENYRFIRDVPDKYDKLYVYGIGYIESEFKFDKYTPLPETGGQETGNGWWFAPCIEIMVSKTPRDDLLTC